jgi:hypothetical protein
MPYLKQYKGEERPHPAPQGKRRQPWSITGSSSSCSSSSRSSSSWPTVLMPRGLLQLSLGAATPLQHGAAAIDEVGAARRLQQQSRAERVARPGRSGSGVPGKRECSSGTCRWHWGGGAYPIDFSHKGLWDRKRVKRSLEGKLGLAGVSEFINGESFRTVYL